LLPARMRRVAVVYEGVGMFWAEAIGVAFAILCVASAVYLHIDLRRNRRRLDLGDTMVRWLGSVLLVAAGAFLLWFVLAPENPVPTDPPMPKSTKGWGR
jgi:hypothetical protein